MKDTSVKLQRCTTTFALGLLTLGLLAGCVTPGAREPAPSPSVSVSREAVWGMSSTNLQLVNNSGRDITVVSLVSDSSRGLGVISNGETASAEGSTRNAYDVEVKVSFDDKQQFELSVTNQWLQPLWVYAGTGFECHPIKFPEGYRNNYFIQDHGVAIERLPDDNWLQIRATFTATRVAGSIDLCTGKADSEGSPGTG
jgi:hypothetical protein